MNALIAPIHTGTINGRPVRFFRAPNQRPEMPWHAVDDLHAALALPRDTRRRLLSIMRKIMAKESRTIATSDGVVVIASHPAAQGLLGAAREAATMAGHHLPDLGPEYAFEGGEAMNKLAGDLPPDAFVAFSLECFRNTHGTEGTAS